MARYSAGARTTTAGSTTLPLGALYSGASDNGWIVEIGVANTTTTAVALKLTRLTTAGTATGITETGHEAVAGTATCSAVRDHTGTAPTLGGDLGYNIVLGGAVGDRHIWTFGDRGLATGLSGTGNGVGIIVATGTGQIIDFYFVWDE